MIKNFDEYLNENKDTKVVMKYNIKEIIKALELQMGSKYYDSDVNYTEWTVDDFKEFINDSILKFGDIVSEKFVKMFPSTKYFLDGKFYQYLVINNGTGLNGNKNFIKFENQNGALYDIWEHIKKELK